MKYCKICGEQLRPQDLLTGTCQDCEEAVTKIVIQKVVKGIYPKRARLDFIKGITT